MIRDTDLIHVKASHNVLKIKSSNESFPPPAVPPYSSNIVNITHATVKVLVNNFKVLGYFNQFPTS